MKNECEYSSFFTIIYFNEFINVFQENTRNSDLVLRNFLNLKRKTLSCAYNAYKVRLKKVRKKP